MKAKRKAPADIDEYIAGFPSDVRAILREVRVGERMQQDGGLTLASDQLSQIAVLGR